jgi:hypothetical protein
MSTIITTSQAPDAKPIGLSRTLTDDWVSLIEVPRYEVPTQSFAGGTDVVPGVAEIISPMLVANITPSTTGKISIRIYRESVDAYFILANELPIPTHDLIAIPLNGQFVYTGDILEVKANANNVITITISYTLGQAEEDDVV